MDGEDLDINLRAKSLSTGRAIRLTWQNPAGYVSTGWAIKRSTLTFALYVEDEVELIVLLDGDVYEYLDENLDEGTIYYYTLFWTDGGLEDFRVSDTTRVIGLSLEDYKTNEGEFVYALMPGGVIQAHESQSGEDGLALQRMSDVIQQGIHVQRGLLSTLESNTFDTMLTGRIGEAKNQYAQLEVTLRGMGYEPLRYAGIAAMRRVGQALPYIRSWKGTCRGVSAYVKALTTWDSTCMVPGDAVCGGFGGLRTYDGESRTRRYDYEVDADFGVTYGVGTFTDSAQSWTVDEFAGGAMRMENGQYLCIASNTEDTLTFEDPTAVVRPYVLVTGTTSMGTLTLVGRDEDAGREFCQTAFQDCVLLDADEIEMPFPTDMVSTGAAMLMPTPGGWTLDGDASIRTVVGINYTLKYTLYAGPHYTTLFPEHDVALKGTLEDPFNPLYGGVSDEAGVPPGPFDVIILVQNGISPLTSTVTAVGADTLTDSSAFWITDQWVGFVVNPNRNNTRTYRVLSNTADTLTVDVSESPDVDLVSVAGAEYFMLTRRDEVAYRALATSVSRFLFQGVRPYIWFGGPIAP